MNWDNLSLVENFKIWFSRQNNHVALLYFTVWEFWKARNRATFQNFFMDVVNVSIKIIGSYKEWHKEYPVKKLRSVVFPSSEK